MENLFSNRRYWMILALYSRVSHHKQKNTKIPFSNKQCWYYFPKVPITSQKKTRKSRFQKEFKKKILALFSRQAQNTKEFPFSNEVSHHKQKKTTTEILFSNRRGIIFQKFHHKPKKPREFRFQIEEALFSRGSHHKPRKNTKIPFSNRRYGNYFPEVPITSQKKQRKFRFQKKRYWHYFPEVPITSQKQKTRKSRFQIEYIGIIFQRLPSQAQKATEIPFSKRRFWHYFPKAPITSQKNHRNPVFT